MSILNRQEKVTFDPESTEVVVRKKRSNKLRAPFSAVTPFTNKNRRRTGMAGDVFDLLDLLERVSHNSFKVFNNLKFNRSESNNISNYVTDETMNKTERESLSRRLKELKDVGLIRRLKKQIDLGENRSLTFNDPRSTFIINPEMLRCINHDEAEHIWKECAQGK